MHPFMTPVLLGLAGFDPFRPDTQLDPPDRQSAEASYPTAGEWRPVVGAYGLRQAEFSEHPLEPWLGAHIARRIKALARKPVTAPVVGNGQRIAPFTVACLELALVVCTPDFIRKVAGQKRFTVFRGTLAQPSLLDKAPSFEPFLCCTDRGPLNLGLALI